MFDVRAPDGTTRRFVTASRTLLVGSGPTCELVLPGAAAVHVRCVLERQHCRIEDMSRAGIVIDGREVTTWQSLGVPKTIRFAGYTIDCIDLRPPFFEASYGAIAPEEAALVDAIVTGDDASRIVYADWLEERGDARRAEIVRTLVAGQAADLDMIDRLVGTNVRWRARVVEPAIEACPRKATCVQHWGRLEHTGRADLRRCGTCAKLVLYCVDAAQAREHVGAGGAVVFDPLVVRWPGDL